MEDLEYDSSSVESILDFARDLTHKSLAEAAWHPEDIANARNRGSLGTLIENFFFGINPGNSPLPDFPEANLELKVTGLLRGPNNQYRAKERLVLSMIHYSSIVDEDWDSSALLRKCRLMLILFYLYETDVPVTQLRFVLPPMLLNLTEQDAEVIQRDWEFIRDKIRNGLAHELSEGDTFYLGACRKGPGGPSERLQLQPFSDIHAKSRAFSLKQSYLNVLLSSHQVTESEILHERHKGIEDSTYARFQPFLGESVDDIVAKVGPISSGKARLRQLVNRILTGTTREALEIAKSGIKVKTVRLSKSGAPKESTSFPAFKYVEIVNQDWEESEFADVVESRFLFVFFKEDETGVLRLFKAKYWNMPFKQRIDAQRVWETTRNLVRSDIYQFPRESESEVAHVRPHGRNSRDLIPTPSGRLEKKMSFWFSRSLIRSIAEDVG
jgi:DNA mismatch repair protein MutH